MIDSASGRRHRAGLGGRPHAARLRRRTRRTPAARPRTSPACRRARSCCIQRGGCGELRRSTSTPRPRARARSSTSTRATGRARRRPVPRGSTSTGAGDHDPDRRRADRDRAQELLGNVRQGLVGKTARVRVDMRPGPTPTENVIAETRGGDPNKVVVVGAHLDSVGTGPGINDNGSGSAALLEIAEQLRGVYPEEQDPLHLVQRRGVRPARLGGLRRQPARDRAAQDRRDAELRHDRFAELRQLRLRRRPVGLAADRRATFRAGGAAVLGDDREDLPGLLQGQRIPNVPTDVRRALGLRPVHRRGRFRPAACSPVPRGSRPREQAAIFGGTAGEQYDPCYHLGCDNFFNNSNRALDQNSDAAAHALITLAQMKIPDRGPTTPAAADAAAPCRDRAPHGLPRWSGSSTSRTSPPGRSTCRPGGLRCRDGLRPDHRLLDRHRPRHRGAAGGRRTGRSTRPRGGVETLAGAGGRGLPDARARRHRRGVDAGGGRRRRGRRRRADQQRRLLAVGRAGDAADGVRAAPVRDERLRRCCGCANSCCRGCARAGAGKIVNV